MNQLVILAGRGPLRGRVPIKEFEIHVEILGVRIFVHRGMTCFHPE